MERRLSNRISSRDFAETGRLAGMFTEESFPVQADGVIEEINGARCVQTKKEQRSRDFVVQNQMQGISYGEHGTYLIAYSKKALAFFFVQEPERIRSLMILAPRGYPQKSPRIIV